MKEYIEQPRDIRSSLIAFDLVAKQQGTYNAGTIKLNYRSIDDALRLAGRVVSPHFF